uniref:Ig-like domain-containing protein n=1 Tax=Cyclopterus lumpus TaxID=8103 RepID=A0A8C2ZYB4_CYCLU
FPSFVSLEFTTSKHLQVESKGSCSRWVSSLLCLLSSSVLFHVHKGVEVPKSQDERFAGRVQWDKDALREGLVRLQVSRLRTDDSGVYLCSVNAGDGSASEECHLNVTGE